MNKIVREHYPAAKLPADLRTGFGPTDEVTVTIVAESRTDEELLAELDRKVAIGLEQLDRGESYSSEEVLAHLRARFAGQPT